MHREVERDEMKWGEIECEKRLKKKGKRRKRGWKEMERTEKDR